VAETAITIRDVAREAGVSVATVSRVLNGSGPVREETRARVWDVARSLRYMPNEAARSLITRETRTLGVVLPDLYGEFFSEVIRGIDQGAQRERYHVLVSGSHDHWDEIAAAMRVMHRRVDGLIIMSPDIQAGALKAALPPGVPVVLLNCVVPGREIAAINIDNRGGAGAMVEHLVSRGHRRLAFIQGPTGNHDAAERLAGFRDALAAAGLTRRRGWELQGDFTEQGGYQAVARLLERSRRAGGEDVAGAGDGASAGREQPDAIFAANDSMAVGALSALRAAGLRVPDDVAVVGFDDIPIARYLSPPLTTVQVPIAELGARALAALLRAVRERGGRTSERESGSGADRSGTAEGADAGGEGQELVATRLVIRRSCGSPFEEPVAPPRGAAPSASPGEAARSGGPRRRRQVR